MSEVNRISALKGVRVVDPNTLIWDKTGKTTLVCVIENIYPKKTLEAIVIADTLTKLVQNARRDGRKKTWLVVPTNLLGQVDEFRRK